MENTLPMWINAMKSIKGGHVTISWGWGKPGTGSLTGDI